jgi:adenosylhomocysteine nucleosidase
MKSWNTTDNTVSTGCHSMRRIAVLAATGRELATVCAAMGPAAPVQQGRLANFRYTAGRTGTLQWDFLRTGLGPEKARQAAEAAIAHVHPQAILSIGYAGALGPQGIGSLLVADAVKDWADKPAIIISDPTLLEVASQAAREAEVGWSRGELVTVGRVAWRAIEKRELAVASGAMAVDMESAATAKVAKARGVPFLAVRAISDKVGEDLPMDVSLWFSKFGSIRVIIEIMRHPSILRRFYHLKLDADFASESLRRFFRVFVRLLESDWPANGTDIPSIARAR